MKTEIRADFLSICVLDGMFIKETNKVLEKALIRIQQNHKVINIKMQQDDCTRLFLIIYEVEVPTL